MDEQLKLTGELMVEIRDAKTGELKSRDVVKNLFVTAAKSSVAKFLIGSSDGLVGTIIYCGVGTNNTAPALGDVKLGTELYRKLISTRSQSANTAIFKTFFNTSEANGALKEAGLFGDTAASGTADSGTLYAHTLFTRTKTSSDTLTLTWTLTVN